jgi:DNA-binding transcriptional MerR regulator
MATTAAAKDTANWLTKKEAAQVLGVSLRQMERIAQLEKFEKTKDAQGRALFREEVIEKLSATRGAAQQEEFQKLQVERVIEKIDARKAQAAAVNGVQIDSARALADYLAKLTEHLAALTTAAREGPKAFLTIEEASRYCGLPQPFIANLLRTDQVNHIGRGPVTWRISRASLDEYGKN